MCRLLAYLGTPVTIDQLIFEPRNSLVKQSYAAKEIEEPLNGDGFGIGFYTSKRPEQPAVFVSTTPAWSNRNLRSIAPNIESTCVFAHVRAASVGDISESNCHPFQFGRFLGMHNGSIGGFSSIKRKVRASLTDELYTWVRGQTDSEHFVALVVERLRTYKPKQLTIAKLGDSIVEALVFVRKLQKAAKVKEETYLNFVFTDGERMIACRYSDDDEPLSLYYSEGARYLCEDGVCRMVPAKDGEHSVLVVSEKLTDLRDDFRPVPKNHMVLVDRDRSVKLREIKV